jgi:hypothetical protein
MCELIKLHTNSLVEGEGDREVFLPADTAEDAFLETHLNYLNPYNDDIARYYILFQNERS